jgi:butyryl-CoA dehydrogenase
LQLLASRITATARRALQVPALAQYAHDLTSALAQVDAATKAAWATGNPLEALPNAVPYMQAFGHTVLAWMWLDVALTGQRSRADSTAAQTQNATHSVAAYAGIQGACDYFYRYELPKIAAWLKVVASRDMTCAQMPEDAF